MLSAVIHSRHSYPAGAFGKTAGRPEVSSLRSSRHVIGLSQKLVKSNPLFLGAQTISSPPLTRWGVGVLHTCACPRFCRAPSGIT